MYYEIEKGLSKDQIEAEVHSIIEDVIPDEIGNKNIDNVLKDIKKLNEQFVLSQKKSP